MKKHISIIGTVGLPAKYGGFEMFVEHLTRMLGKTFYFTVYCSGKEYKERKNQHNNSDLVYIPLKANGIQSILYDLVSILHSIHKKTDCILILGVSGCIFLPFIRLIYRKKIITNIDGLEWRREKWNKPARWLLKLSEKFAVRYSNHIVSDNKVIQDYVLKEYGISSNLIEYGADHAQAIKIENETKLYPFSKTKYAFTVCRIEPENNINLILEAFKLKPELTLVIVGNWALSQYSKEVKEKYSLCENIYFLDPIYNQEDLNNLRSNCAVYVHGHSAGGTNPSLVEAMYLSLPIIAFDVNFNRETTENEALYFDDPDSLAYSIATSSDKILIGIGKKMNSIANKRYLWKIISANYAKLFNN